MNYRILLVDDDPLLLETTKLSLQARGYLVDTASDGLTAIEFVKKSPTGYALVILDYRMEGLNGESTILGLKAVSTELFILVFSGDCSREAVRLTWQAGAIGFLEKNGSAEALLQAVENWCRKYEETICLIPAYSQDNANMLSPLRMIGRSDALKLVALKVNKYQKLSQNVLILGETGTGKELVAKALGGQNGAPFLAVNCAAYRGSTELLESELFGYERGAFTGANQEKKGIFELANGGTVFLDEIHQLSDAAQAKLLRVIQERKIRRVGGVNEHDVKFRLIAAAKPDLLGRCERGEFLSDLYHRVGVLTITIPPLRSRPEDIAPLIDYFSRRYETETGDKKKFLLRTVRYLETYDWPGNVRELENSIYQILADSTVERIAPESLDAKFFKKREEVLPETYTDFKQRQEAAEKAYLAQVLGQAKSKSDAARRLKISPTTLHSVLQRIGLFVPPRPPEADV